MLNHFYIRDFAIVQQLDLGLSSGLSVMTGETGAGKSILIDALALALGERADSNAIRQGAAHAEVIAAFELTPDSDAALWLKKHDLFDDGECLLRRVIQRDKPSKAFINSRPVPVQSVKELGQLLVDVHGQHEHQSLLKRTAQRQILDDYTGIGKEVSELGNHFKELRELQTRLAQLKNQAQNREARLEVLRYQCRELETLSLSKEEVPELENEHHRLSHGASLLEGVQAAVHTLYDDDEHALSQLLARTTQQLEQLGEHDARLDDSTTLLNEAIIQIDEAASQLHQYLNSLELDPQRLQWLNERLAFIHDLSRKHQVKAAELPDVFGRLSQELADLNDADNNLAGLESALTQAREVYGALASIISSKRRHAAIKLGQEITERMQELGMEGGHFEVGCTDLDKDEITAYGRDRIEFLVSANPGQDSRPLSKVASGGELSRISLALQVVIAGLGRIPTLIFDEVDVGIGGRIAEVVGKQLRALGANRQVLCITHLPQVAAQGQQHLQVSKQTENDDTSTQIKELDEVQRIAEVARMLGGIEISQQTLDHAEDMLSRATA